ncbi:carboxylesterase family protein [Aureimonas psammosilenae]|uniref:carboxylesterase family protein n=1 Tax=Aureimonas psammosilenae TaxID=2495496 RepID=UPI001260D11B|nr:dienelactone hydrolase family protein [Aureimonas psammosilenae]
MRITIASLALAAALGLCAVPALGEQTAAHSAATIPADLNYLLSVPAGYETSNETYPLIVWLHGGDQGGSNVEKVRASGLPALIETGREVPYLVFSPQNPSEELLYPIETVKAALDEVVAGHRVDRSLIIVMGYSRGAFAAWAMAEQYPETFAAVVPIAGGGNRHYLNRANEKAAFWIFHGTDDEVIPLSDSVVLYERLKALKRDARLTVFENTSHEAVEAAALNDQGLWDWIAERRLEVSPAEPAPVQSAQ